MENYQFFVVDGSPLICDSKICLQNVEDKTFIMVDMNDINDDLRNLIKTNFPQFPINENVENTQEDLENVVDTQENIENVENTQEKVESCGKEKWSRDSTLALINLRKEYDNLFKSTTVKNDNVWQRITDKMGNTYTRVQIKDRWQYLRKRYIKKKENMSEKSTGAETITFEYYNEMDDLLGKKPNITPTAIASSIKGIEACASVNVTATDNLEEDESEFSRKKLKTDTTKILKTKNKADTIQKFLNEYKEESVKKEQAREKRHQQSLEIRNRAIDIFSQKMDALLEKL